MIVEERCYTIQAGHVNEWLAFYEKMAWPIQQKYLGRCLGFFVTEIGELNQVVHLWQYDDLAHRERARAAMLKDPEWKPFAEGFPRVVVAQTSRILKPTGFSPLQ